MRLGDLDALYDEVQKSKDDNPHLDSRVRRTHDHEHDHFLRMIDEAHAIDAVPVVRCKDCKKAENREHEVFCSLIGAFMGNDDFCSYGERKDGAT